MNLYQWIIVSVGICIEATLKLNGPMTLVTSYDSPTAHTSLVIVYSTEKTILSFTRIFLS